MADLIASARSMTTYTENQFDAIGFPKGGLTPATLTAMVGFSKGEGLQMSPAISQVLGKLQGQTTSILSGLPEGASSAMANVGITADTINASTDPAQTVEGIKNALATDGIMLDTASESSLTQSITAASKLSQLSSKIMAGGPAALMSKLNIARAHIGDAIELKKMTAFTANQTLDKFGSGMSKMSSLSSNGLDGALGNMDAVGAAMKAAGPLCDLKDIGSMGSPVSLIKKLASSKMANSTGVNEQLAKVGVDVNDLSNPVYADKIKNVMSSISDPKVINAVADQMGVKPAGGLPSSANNSLVGALGIAGKANPFASLPSQAPADPNAAANLLSKPSIPPAPALPPTDPAVKPEAATNPVVWGNNNDPTSFGNMNDTTKKKIDAVVADIKELLQTAIDTSKEFSALLQEIIGAYYAVSTSSPDAKDQMAAIKAKYSTDVASLQAKLFDSANAAGRLIKTLPKNSPEYSTYTDLRNGNIETLLKIADSHVKTVTQAKAEVLAKIAGGT